MRGMQALITVAGKNKRSGHVLSALANKNGPFAMQKGR